ncbi:MAG TPA: AsmA family protein [Bryobacteraceae bacterium]|nr:AsmA family protein [Bryobacteraceae bacterium]
MKYFWRTLVIAVLIVVAFGLVAPHVKANGLRPRIQAALEAALNRRVQIGDVHLNLFTAPGFTVEGVLIADDPAAGIEPFAHVESMRARVRIASLLTGRLDFSSLKLDSPSVNLVKMQSGPWNIQPLLDRTSHTSAAHRHTVPDIQILDGRLNFKFGDTKSVFYISGADVDVYPNENGDVVIRFSGAPARTDRGSQAFGQLSARGLLKSGPNGEDQLSMGLRLERTAISEVVRLFNARDMGVHGSAIANARLSGPLSHLEVTGELNVNDIHRWDLMPARGEGWTLNYRGLLDLRAHLLELETTSPDGQAEPVSLKLRLADYLSAPKYTASCTFHELPAASLLETARHMGAPFPPGVQMEGKVEGGINYSSESGLAGQLALQSASLKFPNAASAEFASGPVVFSGDTISFGPTDVRMENGQSAQIEGQYGLGDSHVQLKISTRQLTIAEVQSSAEHVISAPPIPLLEKLRQGTWKGWIAFDRQAESAGVWSGEYDLQNAVMEIPGLAAPLRFAAASVEMKDGGIQISRIRARAGDVRMEGEYRYDPEAGRPHRVRIAIAELQLAALEHLMLPTLNRNEGFLARTFRLRKEALPKWLQDREVEGSVQVNRLLNGDAPVGSLAARLVWDGPTILLSNVDCRLEEMHATGKMTVNLASALPAYSLSGRIENLDYRNGQLGLEGELETSGIGENLLLNIRSQGTFEGQGIELSPDSLVREISGSYRVAAVSGIPRLVLSNVQLTQGADTFSGQGSSQPDGHVVLELTSGRRQMRLTGMLLPMHPEPAAAR